MTRGTTVSSAAALGASNDGGLDAPGAIALTRASRKDTIERGAQIDFIHAWDWPPREALE